MLQILNTPLPPLAIQPLCSRLAVDSELPAEPSTPDYRMSPPESLVPHLIGTNAALTGPLAAKVRDTFSQVRDNVAALDTRISWLSSTLLKLVERRDRLQDYLAQHQALLSPARRIPYEIWGEIFQYCLLSDVPVGDVASSSPVVSMGSLNAPSSGGVVENGDTRVPWVFTRISRDLRAAAMSCPRLWTKVSVCVDDYAALDRRRLRLLAQVLTLSGDVPLSVTLFGRAYDANAFEMWTRSPAAEHLVATCHRWERLRLSYLPSPTHNKFYMALRGRLDSLRVLEMHTPELPKMKPLAYDIFGHTPNLRSLTVIGSFPYDALQLPLQQVTSLSMRSILYFPRMIQICPNLVDLSLTLPPSGVRIEPFTLLKGDHVQTLRLDLHTFDSGMTEKLLKSLDLPSLSTLDLECQHVPGNGVLKFFKTNNTITHLTLRVQKWPEDSFFQSLRSISSLEHLGVSIWPGSIKDAEPLLDDLARNLEQQHPVLPKLQTLELISRVADFPVEPFIRLVRARWALGRRGGAGTGMLVCPVAPLTGVMVYLHGLNVPDHVLATLWKLNDLKDGGLDIRAYAKGLLMSGVGHRIF